MKTQFMERPGFTEEELRKEWSARFDDCHFHSVAMLAEKHGLKLISVTTMAGYA